MTLSAQAAYTNRYRIPVPTETELLDELSQRADTWGITAVGPEIIITAHGRVVYHKVRGTSGRRKALEAIVTMLRSEQRDDAAVVGKEMVG